MPEGPRCAARPLHETVGEPQRRRIPGRRASNRDDDAPPRRIVHGSMKHATSRMLFAYWDALRGERSSPERGAINPGAIRHILADTFILEISGLYEAVFE